jgi:hypothetical protein
LAVTAAESGSTNCETLKIYGAIVLIPRHALVPGHHYRVEVKTLRRTVNWSFAIVAEHQKYATER